MLVFGVNAKHRQFFNQESRDSIHGNTIHTPAAASAPSYIGPFITVTVLFGIFGFLTNLNSNLMPHLRSIFDLSYGPAMLPRPPGSSPT